MDQIIDINRAGAEELAELEGVGEELANRIVLYRNRVGGFAEVDDLSMSAGSARA